MPKKKTAKKKAVVKKVAAKPTAAGAESGAAHTNRPTQLVRLGEPSIPLPKDHPLDVDGPNGPFWAVSTVVGGGLKFGDVVKEHVDFD